MSNLDTTALARRLKRLYPKRRIQVLLANPDSTPSISLEHYKDDCVAFAREVLGVELTPDQQEIVRAFPGRVKVNSGHSVGKSYIAAVLTLWWFFTRNPSVIVTTAPTKHHVETVLWTEIRMLAMRAIRKLPPQFLPKAAKIWDHPDHWAEGVTTSSGEGFQGRHRSSMLFIMDECHDDITEVMTEHGWMLFSDLTGKERLLTMDEKTQKSEYLLPDRVVCRPHEGKMFLYQTAGVDFCVTPGHKMLWQSYYSKDHQSHYGAWQRSRMDELVSGNTTRYMTRKVYWEGIEVKEFELPGLESDRKSYPSKSLDMDLWLSLLGWYFSEGCLLRAPNKQVYGISITQKDSDTVEEIRCICERLGLNPKVYTCSSNTQVQVHSAQIGRWFAQFGDSCLERHLPRFITELSIRQIDLFLSSYSRGDGYYQNPNREVIYTSSLQLASGLHELILKTGADSTVTTRSLVGSTPSINGRVISATVDGFVVTRVRKSKRIRFASKKVKEVDYDGMVYCAELPRHNLLLTRRNGKVLWSGNCEDVDSIYWTATDTMYQPENDHGWLAIGNPLTTSTQSYLEDLATGPNGQPKWKLFSLSALNHPNVIAELAGKPPIIPNAVTLNQVRQWIQDWTDPVYPGDQQPEDVEWPPGSGTFIRPGPTFKARVLGVRPSSGVDTVFSLAAWNRMLTPSWNNDQCWMSGTGIQIGVDPAAYGDDFTALHVKSGPLSLHHESHNGWNVDKTAGRIKELCSQYSHQYNSWAQLPRPQMKPTDVDVLIEADGGLGVGVFSHRDQFHRWKLVTVGGSSSIVDINNSKMYYNVRSQIWIEAARKAIAGQMDISRLAQDVKERLRLQLLSPSYEVRPDGCRKVESKDEIKKRLKRSPDDGDAILISHYSPASYTTTMVLKTEQAE